MEYLKIVASNINKLNKKIFLKLQAIKTNVHFSCTVLLIVMLAVELGYTDAILSYASFGNIWPVGTLSKE